jgi:predicted Zn-dependent protease
MADFTELTTLEPTESYNHAMLSQIYEATGDLDRAITEYDVVIRLDSSGLGNSSRAKLYLAKGDTARAIADYTVTINSGLK